MSRIRWHRAILIAVSAAWCVAQVSTASAWDPLQKAERAAGAGQRALAAGDSAAALEQMLRAQALAPKDTEIRAGLAETFYDTGDFEAAIRQLQPLADDEAPAAQRERALYNAGNAAFRAQDLERALELYTDALLTSDAPPSPDLLHNLELAQQLFEQQQQEQQQQQGEDGEPQDQEEQQDQQDQEQQQSDSEQDQSDQEQQQEQSEQQQQESESEPQDQQQPPPSESEAQDAAADSMQAPPPDLEAMTPEEAMRLLQALDFDEEELRKSIQRRLRGDDEENEHDW